MNSKPLMSLFLTKVNSGQLHGRTIWTIAGFILEPRSIFVSFGFFSKEVLFEILMLLTFVFVQHCHFSNVEFPSVQTNLSYCPGDQLVIQCFRIYMEPLSNKDFAPKPLNSDYVSPPHAGGMIAVVSEL